MRAAATISPCTRGVRRTAATSGAANAATRAMVSRCPKGTDPSRTPAATVDMDTRASACRTRRVASPTPHRVARPTAASNERSPGRTVSPVSRSATSRCARAWAMAASQDRSTTITDDRSVAVQVALCGVSEASAREASCSCAATSTAVVVASNIRSTLGQSRPAVKALTCTNISTAPATTHPQPPVSHRAGRGRQTRRATARDEAKTRSRTRAQLPRYVENANGLSSTGTW